MDNNNNNTQDSEIIDDILNNNEPPVALMRVADKNMRFLNFVIDTVVFYILIFLQGMFLGGVLGVIPDEDSASVGIYTIAFYVFYQALFEYFLGKTPGKFVSKTHVVTADGKRPTFLRLLGRNLCRLIPFDNISFLFSKRGFHDEISKTSVVYDN